MRETLPSARSDGAPLRRFSTLYIGMKGCTGRRQRLGKAPNGSWVGRQLNSRRVTEQTVGLELGQTSACA